MLKNKFFKIVSILTLSSILFVGCGSVSTSTNSNNEKGSNSTESKVDKIKKSGKLVLATSADFPPYEFHKQINGKDEIMGFDISIANEIAKDLGVTLEIKDMKFEGLLAALDSGNADLVVAGMTPTEERKKNVDFSKMYYQSVQSLVIRAEDKDKFKSVEDLKGKKVGVQKGSIQEDVAKKQLTNAETKSLGKITDLVLELKNKKVDALVLTLPVAKSYMSANKDIMLSDIKLKDTDEGCAVALKKGNTELVQAVDKTLTRLMSENKIDKFITEATEAAEITEK